MKNKAIISPLPTDTRPPAVNPEIAQKLLEQNGLATTQQQAAAVLEFLYTLARTTQQQ